MIPTLVIDDYRVARNPRSGCRTVLFHCVGKHSAAEGRIAIRDLQPERPDPHLPDEDGCPRYVP